MKCKKCLVFTIVLTKYRPGRGRWAQQNAIRQALRSEPNPNAGSKWAETENSHVQTQVDRHRLYPKSRAFHPPTATSGKAHKKYPPLQHCHGHCSLFLSNLVFEFGLGLVKGWRMRRERRGWREGLGRDEVLRFLRRVGPRRLCPMRGVGGLWWGRHRFGWRRQLVRKGWGVWRWWWRRVRMWGGDWGKWKSGGEERDGHSWSLLCFDQESEK